MTGIRKAILTISGDKPLEISDVSEGGLEDLTEAQRQIIDQVGNTIKAYLDAIRELLSGKYSHLKDWAPKYLSEQEHILVVHCSNGIVIRFEKKDGERQIAVASSSEDVSKIAFLLSQGVVRVHPNKEYVSSIPTDGIELRLVKGNMKTDVKEEFLIARLGFDVVAYKPQNLLPAPRKPYCLLSVQNMIEIHIEGILLKDQLSKGDGKRFLTRSVSRIPVGWECVEIYPFFDREQWKPDYAPIWAENDLLAIVATRQFRESQFESLDPMAAARQHYGEVLQRFKAMLDSNPDREEILQVFLRENPVLLCPTAFRTWPKLSLGARKTDFVFQEAAGDYVLVELERSTLPLFNKDGHASQDLNHALGQVLDWKRYLEDNLSTVQRELSLTGISTNPKSLVIIGRSETLTEANRRKLTTMENESPRLKIMTYDDVYDNAKAFIENLLGPLWEVPGNTRIYYLPK